MTTIEPTGSTLLPRNLVIPGDRVSASRGFMRGHGTYVVDGELRASVAGVVEQVNKLVCVRPVNSRYGGEIGDVVIGQITGVQQKRWKVDANARLNSILQLSSVNLPGGELRRKSVEDERAMREYLREGDLISAEVQQIFHDGVLSLHTRNLRYGKLSQGILVKVYPSLVKRRKSHFHNLPCGASIILGCNGYIWISRTIDDEAGLTGGYVQDLNQIVPLDQRKVIVRIHNCVALLAANLVLLYDTTIMHAYEISLPYPAKDLLIADIGAEIAQQVRNRIAIESA